MRSPPRLVDTELDDDVVDRTRRHRRRPYAEWLLEMERVEPPARLVREPQFAEPRLSGPQCARCLGMIARPIEPSGRARLMYSAITSPGSPSEDEGSTIEQHGSLAEAPHRAEVVADEQHGPAVARHVAHLAQALLLEFRVADGEHLVDQQDLGFEVGRDGERQAHVHAARVALDGRVEETLDTGELDDLVELRR